VGVKPTSIRSIGALTLACGLLGWALTDWMRDQGRIPQVPWLAVMIVWAVAFFVGAWAVVARLRIRAEDATRRMAPLVAARSAALALAGSRTGAAVLGGYGGISLRLFLDGEAAPALSRAGAAALAASGGLGLLLVALGLERTCRLKDAG
jgi:hypothetical protein